MTPHPVTFMRENLIRTPRPVTFYGGGLILKNPPALFYRGGPPRQPPPTHPPHFVCHFFRPPPHKKVAQDQGGCVGNQIVVPVARFSPPACDPFRLVAGQPKNYSIIVAAAEFPGITLASLALR